MKLFDDKDHAAVYSQYRPTYPDTVYKTIKDFYDSKRGETCNFELAVDVGCGNGQSTLPLCKLFKHVIGYDVSEQQVTAGPKDVSNLTFKIGPGEDLGFLKDNSVDLMTVAQALHWFDLDKFYNEVRRVVKPGGVFVTYGYGNNVVDKEVAQRLMEEVLRRFPLLSTCTVGLLSLKVLICSVKSTETPHTRSFFKSETPLVGCIWYVYCNTCILGALQT